MTQIIRLFIELRSLALLAVASTLTAAPARADIDLRVESRPNTGAIEAYVRVTDGSGSVTGLTRGDFAVKLDAAPLDTFTLSLPPDQDPAQKVSVVFVNAIDSFVASQIVNFVNQMAVGDYAAIIGFVPMISESSLRPFARRPVVQPLTQIDAGVGTDTLVDFLSLPGHFYSSPNPTMVFDAMNRAVNQFVAPPVALPNGPKAIILIGSHRDNYSTQTQSDLVALANDNSIAVFTVRVANTAENAVVNALMESLAEDTGGSYSIVPDAAQVAGTLATLAGILNDSYRLMIPQTAVTDCYPHVLEVTSQAQSESIPFTRCDTTPDELQFTSRDNVGTGTIVVSDAVTVTGIDGPVAISVHDGEYSIGCSRTFTVTPGFIFPGDKVCVRHTASVASGDSTSTLLIVGGVPSWFWSTTSAGLPPRPPKRASGGGAAGLIELLFLLGVLLSRRQRRFQSRKRCQVYFSTGK